jgi:hypothetical protein
MLVIMMNDEEGNITIGVVTLELRPQYGRTRSNLSENRF